MIEAGEDLRSRCLLHGIEPVKWELLGRPGDPARPFALNGDDAIDLATQALAERIAEGDTAFWPEKHILITDTRKMTDDTIQHLQQSLDAGGEHGGREMMNDER